jgi:hypothetical protein
MTSKYCINYTGDASSWVNPVFTYKNPTTCNNDYSLSAPPPGDFYLPGDNNPDTIEQCVNGAVGDQLRTLYNDNTSKIGERGVELYENVGLDTNFTDAVLIDGGSDTYDNLQGYYNDYYLKTATVQNWGRMVSLIGSVEFSTFDFYASYTVEFPYGEKIAYYTLAQIFSPYTGYRTQINQNPLVETRSLTARWSSLISSGYAMNIQTPMLSKYIMRMRFNAPSVNPNTEYNYFGSSKITINSTNGITREYTADTASTIIYQYKGLYYFLQYYEPATRTLWVDATSWFISGYTTAGIFNPPAGYMPSMDPRLFTVIPGPDKYAARYANVSAITPAPLTPITHAYDGVGDHNNTAPYRPVSSGFKSMYIPPHMEVQSYSQTVYDYSGFQWDAPGSLDNEYLYKQYAVYGNASPDFLSTSNNLWIPRLAQWKLGYTTIAPGSKNQTTPARPNNGSDNVLESYYSLPLKFYMSEQSNGCFQSLGTNRPNSLQRVIGDPTWNINANTGTENIRNITAYGKAGGIYSAALVGIKVCVICDSSLQQYFGPSDLAVPNYFMPEIILNPSFDQGTDYVNRLPNGTDTDPFKSYEFNTTQKITDVTAFWSAANPDYDAKLGATISINQDYQPWQVIPWKSTQSTVSQLATRLKIGSKNKTLRIKSFTPVRGVYSVEWLYILYNCAIKCQQFPEYNSGKYVTCPKTSNDLPSSQLYASMPPVGCCVECSLFVNPYYVSGLSSGGVSQSDVFMKNYCGLRNLTYYYAPFESITRPFNNNECVCETSGQFCPNEFNANCSTVQPNAASSFYYRSQQGQTSGCNDGAVQYCNTQIIQFGAATQGGTNTGNTNLSLNSQCNTQAVASDTPEDPPDTPEVASVNWWLLIIILAAILIAIIIGFFGLKKWKDSRNK